MTDALRKMKKVACIGNITTDIIVAPADSIPASGTLRAVETVQMHVGGCASNAAIDLARLGVPVELITKIGKDNFGEFVKTTCVNENVGIRGVVTDPKSVTTGSVVCVSSEGERSFLYNPGSSADFKYENIDLIILKECDIIFVAGAFLLTGFDGQPCAMMMEKAKSLGKFTVMDTAWDFNGAWLDTIKPVLPHLDLFMPSLDEAAKITKKENPRDMAKFLFDQGVKTVIIKTGKSGALVCESRDNMYEVPAYSHIKPVDTTGAGDSFCAGFLAGIAQGWDYKRSAGFANAVGAHCVMALGASSGIKTIAETLKFIDENTDNLPIISEC